jgi:Peptidase family M23
MVRSSTTILAVMVAIAGGEQIGTTAEPELLVTVVARAVEPGEVVQLSVTCSCSTPLEQVRAEAFGHPITFAPVGQQWRGLVGIDVDVTRGSYMVPITATGQGLPTLTTVQTLRVAPRVFATRRLRVNPEFVEPPESQVARILEEAERIASLLKIVSPRQWDGTFLRPAAGPATSNFGVRSIYNGQRRSPHAGIDFRGPTGTPVTAPSAGRIALAEALFFTGNTVLIDHGQGLYSLLAHLSRFAVTVGDEVMPGDVVGFVGATGRVTGPHLHWAVRLHEARVDPLSLVDLGKR